MKTFYVKCISLYRKKSLSIDVKLRQYNSAVKSEELCISYGSYRRVGRSCKKRRIFGTIVGPIKNKDEVIFWNQTGRYIVFVLKQPMKWERDESSLMMTGENERKQKTILTLFQNMKRGRANNFGGVAWNDFKE